MKKVLYMSSGGFVMSVLGEDSEEEECFVIHAGLDRSQGIREVIDSTYDSDTSMYLSALFSDYCLFIEKRNLDREHQTMLLIQDVVLSGAMKFLGIHESQSEWIMSGEELEYVITAVEKIVEKFCAYAWYTGGLEKEMFSEMNMASTLFQINMALFSILVMPHVKIKK